MPHKSRGLSVEQHEDLARSLLRMEQAAGTMFTWLEDAQRKTFTAGRRITSLSCAIRRAREELSAMYQRDWPDAWRVRTYFPEIHAPEEDEV